MLERLSFAQHLRCYIDKAGLSLGRINTSALHELRRELDDVGMGILNEPEGPDSG